MPLNIDMGLPIITWELGRPNSNHQPVKLRSLFDSCGCANVGRLEYHLWIISQRPELVSEFRFYDSHQPFDPVSLDGVVSQPSELEATKDGLLSEEHGLLTAIVRYWTSYKLADGSPLTISFGLGENVSTNTLTGLPLIQSLAFVTDYGNFKAHSPILCRTFNLDRSPGKCGLPDDAQLNVKDFCKQYDQQLAAARSNDTPVLSPAAQARSEAFFSPSLLTSIDDPNTAFLRRRVVAASNPSQQ